MFSFNGLKIIESPGLMQTWQLDDWTKELMGPAWVENFNIWAESNLTKQPACYIMNGDTIVAHPLIIKELKDHAKIFTGAPRIVI